MNYELAKVALLNDSQAYYEKNLNAFNNNMSLLALNTFEISSLLEVAQKDNNRVLKIAKSIAAHTNFIKQKSKDLSNKMRDLHSKLDQ